MNKPLVHAEVIRLPKGYSMTAIYPNRRERRSVLHSNSRNMRRRTPGRHVQIVPALEKRPTRMGTVIKVFVNRFKRILHLPIRQDGPQK